MSRSAIRLLLVMTTGLLVANNAAAQDSHEELVRFFREWRAFQAPATLNGLPDYSPGATAKQAAELPKWIERLVAFDTTGWSVPEQIDWHLIRAEMNGLDFDHRVLRPWERDPAFYVWYFPSKTDVPSREGPVIHGAIEYAYLDQPLSKVDAADVARRLSLMPDLYERARKDLTGNARDLWVTGARSIREQAGSLESLGADQRGTHPELSRAASDAAKASLEFAEWLDAQSQAKTGPSGIGKENYNWYIRNVHLIPLDWEEEKLLVERELYRSLSALRMQEHANRHLPELAPITDAETYDREMTAAIEEYLTFLEDEEILTIKPWMAPALEARAGRFTESDGLRGFFSEVTYLDPMVMRTHDYHWIELARRKFEPNPDPIRSAAPLYNMYDTRAEGMATAMEELMMRAGAFSNRPRAKELIWILLTQRAARGLGSLYQHGREMSFDEATKFAASWVPRGLLPADGATIQHEEQFYLQQPGYGTSYVTGKILIDQLIAEYSRKRGDAFVMRDFMDEFNAVGIIPMSLVYWQMTGDRSMLDGAIGN